MVLDRERTTCVHVRLRRVLSIDQSIPLSPNREEFTLHMQRFIPGLKPIVSRAGMPRGQDEDSPGMCKSQLAALMALVLVLSLPCMFGIAHALCQKSGGRSGSWRIVSPTRRLFSPCVAVESMGREASFRRSTPLCLVPPLSWESQFVTRALLMRWVFDRII